MVSVCGLEDKKYVLSPQPVEDVERSKYKPFAMRVSDDAFKQALLLCNQKRYSVKGGKTP